MTSFETGSTQKAHNPFHKGSREGNAHFLDLYSTYVWNCIDVTEYMLQSIA